MASKHDVFIVDGCRFNTKARDDVRVTQNSGVSIVAQTLQVSSARDKNPIYGEMKFYGVIQEIWELDYRDFRMPMFKCDWVDIKNSVEKEKLGFIKVDLNKIGHKKDSFIMASQAKQVFYVDDPTSSRWSIVLASQPRDKLHDDDQHEFGELQISEKECGFIPEFEGVEATIGPYVRRDGDGIWIVRFHKYKCHIILLFTLSYLY